MGRYPASDSDTTDGGVTTGQQQDRKRGDDAGQTEGGQSCEGPVGSGPEVPVLAGDDDFGGSKVCPRWSVSVAVFMEEGTDPVAAGDAEVVEVDDVLR